MDYFMGSAEEGKRALEELLAFAATTPFEFPALQEATIMLMGAGYTFDQAKRALKAFGDAAGMTGAGMLGMQNAMLGFTQIAAVGTLNLEELRQIALNLRVPLTAFAEELGVAKDKIGDVGRVGIPAAKAMEAIVRTLEKRYAGGMDKLSKSLLGLVSTVKDTARLTVVAFGAGMAEPVKRILTDMLGMADYTSESYKQLGERLEEYGRRIGTKFERVYQGVKQVLQDISKTPGFDEMSWGEKISIALDRILEAVTAWLEGPGGEMMQKTGEILGKMLEAGLRGMIPNLVPLGAEMVKALLNGIISFISTNPLATALLGGLIGARFGGLHGAAIGAGVGLIAGGIGWVYEQIKGRKTPTKHQLGGIYSKPHIGLVAEAGPEAVIPLSARFRTRALALYKETGRRLGVKSYTEGGFVGPGFAISGSNYVQTVDIIPATGGNSYIQTIDITSPITVNVYGMNGEIPSSRKIADEIADELAIRLKGIFLNIMRKR